MRELKSWQAKFKDLTTCVSGLQASLKELQATLPQVDRFVSDVNQDLNKWQFKSKYRLEQINKILDRLTKKFKEQFS